MYVFKISGVSKIVEERCLRLTITIRKIEVLVSLLRRGMVKYQDSSKRSSSVEYTKLLLS